MQFSSQTLVCRWHGLVVALVATAPLLVPAITQASKKKRPKTTTIGTGNFSIPAGKTATVALTLNSAGRALLRADHGRLSATLTILTSSPAPTRTQHVSVHLAQRGTAG